MSSQFSLSLGERAGVRGSYTRAHTPLIRPPQVDTFSPRRRRKRNSLKRYKVKVIPRSSRNQVMEISSAELKVKLTAPPVEGKANEALLDLLADHFKIRRSSLRILSGTTGRNKIIERDD